MSENNRYQPGNRNEQSWDQGGVPPQAPSRPNEPAGASGFTPAPLGRRAAAGAIDIGIYVLLILPLLIQTANLSRLLLGGDFGVVGGGGGPLWVTLGWSSIWGLLAGIYALTQLILNGLKGWTLGKRLLGLRTINIATGKVPGFGRALLRGVILAVANILPGLGFALVLASPLFNLQRRGWQDIIAGTMIVEAQASSRNTSFAPAAESQSGGGQFGNQQFGNQQFGGQQFGGQQAGTRQFDGQQGSPGSAWQQSAQQGYPEQQYSGQQSSGQQYSGQQYSGQQFGGQQAQSHEQWSAPQQQFGQHPAQSGQPDQFGNNEQTNEQNRWNGQFSQEPEVPSSGQPGAPIESLPWEPKSAPSVPQAFSTPYSAPQAPDRPSTSESLGEPAGSPGEQESFGTPQAMPERTQWTPPPRPITGAQEVVPPAEAPSEQIPDSANAFEPAPATEPALTPEPAAVSEPAATPEPAPAPEPAANPEPAPVPEQESPAYVRTSVPAPEPGASEAQAEPSEQSAFQPPVLESPVVNTSAAAPAEPAPAPSDAEDEIDEETVLRAPVEEDFEDLEKTQIRPRPQTSLATITFDDGEQVGLRGLALFGRNPAPLDDEQVTHLVPVTDRSRSMSKTHFMIGFDAHGAFVKDRNSTNGTRIRRGDTEVPVIGDARARLFEGDVVCFGDREATVHIGG